MAEIKQNNNDKKIVTFTDAFLINQQIKKSSQIQEQKMNSLDCIEIKIAIASRTLS